MTGQKRRPRGEGGLWFDEKRRRWIASKTVGYDARGKRIVRRGSGTSQSAAIRELRKRVKDFEAGLVQYSERYTVREAVEDWLGFGLGNHDAKTIEKYTDLCETHVIPNLGGRRLRDLQATEVDRWLKSLTEALSTRSLQEVHSCLNRAVRRRWLVGTSSATSSSCARPRGAGRAGRPSP